MYAQHTYPAQITKLPQGFKAHSHGLRDQMSYNKLTGLKLEVPKHWDVRQTIVTTPQDKPNRSFQCITYLTKLPTRMKIPQLTRMLSELQSDRPDYQPC